MGQLKLLPIIVSAIVLAGATFGLGSPAANAAPQGAAQDLTVYSQGCLPNGSVLSRFSWDPSGLGTQWFDISAVNNGFTSNFLNAGPLASGHDDLDWYQLVSNTRYYVRVNTFTSVGWLSSDIITFVTPSCTGFTPPTNPTTNLLSPNSVRFSWDRGQNNDWFCVDTAFTQNDLLNYTGSFHNWGCGTTSTSITVNEIACGAKHYWRVYGVGGGGAGYSPVAEFTSSGCDFTPPTNPEATVQGPNTVKFDWDRGTNNSSFCIDTAKSESDLTNLTGSWMNHGCGVTGETFTSTVVPCDAKQWFRIWAVGLGASGYSPVGTFTTGACPITAPTNLDADTIDADSIHYEWTKGIDNLWSCVDTAESEADLNGLTGTWANHGCGTTDDELVVDNLKCNTTYYWRVFARGSGGSSAVSQIAGSKTAACP
jgi:hypothetical protein